jgi:hypothetical protein
MTRSLIRTRVESQIAVAAIRRIHKEIVGCNHSHGQIAPGPSQELHISPSVSGLVSAAPLCLFIIHVPFGGKRIVVDLIDNYFGAIRV